jgi:hypothetical protein
LGCPVRHAEIDAGDSNESEYDRGGLGDVATIRPLNPLKLGPAGAQEGDRTAMKGLGGLAGDRRAIAPSAILECDL